MWIKHQIYHQNLPSGLFGNIGSRSNHVDHAFDLIYISPFRAGSRLALAGTIQFGTAIQLAKQRLGPLFPSLAIPKCRSV